MQTIKFDITGMSCGHCVKAVEKALATLDGVKTDSVTIGTATVTMDPAKLSADRITAVIEDAGYKVTAAH